MCNTTCSFDDASLLTDEPEIIEMTESASIVVVKEKVEEDVDEDFSNSISLYKERLDEDFCYSKSLEGVGKLIQDLFHSDNDKVNATLDALNLDLENDKNKCESFVTAGGCFVVVHLMKNCLDKAIGRIPACDQVTELNELTELSTLHETLNVINNLTYQKADSVVGIAASGGVEAVVKVMKAFPKCQTLQEDACMALGILADCSIGSKKAVETDGIQILLAAVNNHMGSAKVCEEACWAMENIAHGSKETTGLLIALGGGAAVAKVRTKWPDNDDVQSSVRNLVKLIGAEMKAWADEGQKREGDEELGP
jgi:hypothetical protein